MLARQPLGNGAMGTLRLPCRPGQAELPGVGGSQAGPRSFAPANLLRAANAAGVPRGGRRREAALVRDRIRTAGSGVMVVLQFIPGVLWQS